MILIAFYFRKLGNTRGIVDDADDDYDAFLSGLSVFVFVFFFPSSVSVRFVVYECSQYRDNILLKISQSLIFLDLT